MEMRVEILLMMSFIAKPILITDHRHYRIHGDVDVYNSYCRHVGGTLTMSKNAVIGKFNSKIVHISNGEVPHTAVCTVRASVYRRKFTMLLIAT